MAEYGMIYDTSDIKKQLVNANRDYTGRKTWENLYSSVDLAKRQQLGELEQDYAKAISDAYAASYQSDVAIASSNLGQGYKQLALDETEIALQQAYDSYRQNYLQGVGEIEEASAEAKTNINAALTEQAEFTKQFANAPYEYLQYVFDKYAEGDDADNIFLTDEMWKRYTYTDETGETLLKSWEDIAAYGAYEEHADAFGNLQKEWTGLYDESGNLTIKGADFYDQMINQLAYEGSDLSFGKWLAETNEELYNWSQSYNPYDYTEAGTNVGSFKTLVGLTSTDEEYSFIERFGGISRNELDVMYSKFTDKANESVDTSGKNSKNTLSQYVSLTNELKTLTDNLGITESLENEMGMSFDDLAKYIFDLQSGTKSNKDMWLQGVGTSLMSTGSGMAGGLAASFNPAGAIIGGIAGLLTSTVTAAMQSKKTKRQNVELAKAGHKAYNDLVRELVAYSYSQQRQKQGEFYKRNK